MPFSRGTAEIMLPRKELNPVAWYFWGSHIFDGHFWSICFKQCYIKSSFENWCDSYCDFMLECKISFVWFFSYQNNFLLPCSKPLYTCITRIPILYQMFIKHISRELLTHYDRFGAHRESSSDCHIFIKHISKEILSYCDSFGSQREPSLGCLVAIKHTVDSRYLE